VKDIEGPFLGYESQNAYRSVFEDLLGKKSEYEMPGKEILLKEFDRVYSKTGLSKLKQIIEFTHILLESKHFYITV
jgi:hypothetical protein